MRAELKTALRLEKAGDRFRGIVLSLETVEGQRQPALCFEVITEADSAEYALDLALKTAEQQQYQTPEAVVYFKFGDLVIESCATPKRRCIELLDKTDQEFAEETIGAWCG